MWRNNLILCSRKLLEEVKLVAKMEPILNSQYDQVYEFPKFECKNACEFLLGHANRWAKLRPEKNWLTNTMTDESIKFSDVDPMSRKSASAMYKRGMRKGDVALYMTMNPTKIFTTIMGIWRVGGITYSVYPEDTFDTLLMRVKQTKCRWIICDPISVAQVKRAQVESGGDLEIIVFGEVEGCTNIDELYEDDGSACPAEPVGDLDDPVVVLTTSGTTGMSKGAIYTNRNVLHFCVGTAGIPPHEPPGLLVGRSTHVLGCLFPFRNLYIGVWILGMHAINKDNIFHAVDKYKPCLILGFPTIMAPLAADPEAKNFDLSSLEMVCTGGIVLTPQFYDLMMSMPNVKYVINGFGMTECGVLTTTVDLAYKDRIKMIENVPYLSVGRLYPHSSMKVIDIDSGKTVGVNCRGELAFRSPIMSVGYFGQLEETKKAFKDGWLLTGDLGYYDEDGNIYVVDRLKETFKHWGNWVSPAELEEILLRHPAVEEPCCFGIPDPDGGDTIPRAVLTLKPDAPPDTKAEDIRKFVDDQVASYKKLDGGVYIVKTLPRGKTGKVLRALAATMDLNTQ